MSVSEAQRDPAHDAATTSATPEASPRPQLQQRAGQLEQLLTRLRQRLHASDAGDDERRAMGRAAADYAHELQQIRQRLSQPTS